MSVVGRWSVAIQTPFGEQVVAIEFSDERTGVAHYGSESVGLGDVSASNDNASWSVVLMQPVKVTVRCFVTIDGDAMSGTAKAGFFGQFPLRGQRSSS